MVEVYVLLPILYFNLAVAAPSQSYMDPPMANNFVATMLLKMWP